MSLVCGSCTEHEKASVDTVGRSEWAKAGGERERAEAATEGTEYSCGLTPEDPAAQRSDDEQQQREAQEQRDVGRRG